MPRSLPKYVIEYLDTTGKVRRYFRYKGKCTPIPYRPGNKAFDLFYRELLIKNGVGQGPKPQPKTGSIYFIRCGDMIKIGYSLRPQERIRGLQTASGVALELLCTMPGTKADERRLHKRFHPTRREGEWFTATPELLAYIVAAQLKAA